jgi:hypothetical protein
MDATTLKTRHGLILQRTVAEALRRAGITFKENWQYHSDYERPDFTIPDTNTPRFAVEVHQTDARNAFQMKILRSFNAVTEAKAFFGDSLVSVNVLFGDPDREVPASNVRALFGFFDVNIVPRNDATNAREIKRLEDSALKLANDKSLSVVEAAKQLVKIEKEGINSLSTLIANSLRMASAKPTLSPLWQAERRRISILSTAPSAGTTTHYKWAILQSLFLSDEHFTELLKKRDPNKCSSELKEQLVLTRLAEEVSSIRGKVLVLNAILREFINTPKAIELRSLCENRLDNEPAMHWFFEDIRNRTRREQMVTHFLEVMKAGFEGILTALQSSLLTNTYSGIEHTRSWVADLMPLYVAESHNSFNRRMFQHPKYKRNLGNPFNNIAIKSPRLGSSPEVLCEYAKVATMCFQEAYATGTRSLFGDSAKELLRRFVALRTGAAIKLQKLNPLYLVVESVAQELGLIAIYSESPSFLSDLSDPSDPVGKYDLYQVSSGKQVALLNALYIGEGYGSDHKADEWSARRRSLGYRFDPTGVHPVRRAGYIFVIDGIWVDKSIKKLHTAGWTHIIRLPELELVLRDIFKKS